MKRQHVDESFRYWELPDGAEVREKPPLSEDVPDEIRDDFDHLLSAGHSILESNGDENVFVVIGLDFGTSSTKVIVRFPFEPGQPTIAIPAPPYCRSMNHPYLWQTVLWFTNNGEFAAYPKTDARLLHTLKTGLMRKGPDTPIVLNDDQTVNVTRVEAATAYIAFVIRYVAGWLASNQFRQFRGRSATWLVNVGLPAASYDTESLLVRYRRVVAAALALAKSSETVNVGSVRRWLRDCTVEQAAMSADSAENFGIAVIAETAAEATGFAKSDMTADGLYLMVDVGATTMDVCTFRLNTSQEEHAQYPLLRADVKALGVEAFHWFMRDGRPKDEFKNQVNRCIRRVVWDTKRCRDPKADCWRSGNELPLFLTGGGASNRLHRDIVESLGPWLEEHTSNAGIRLIDLPQPATCDFPESLPDFDFGRLTVAWGLSYRDEIGDIVPPSDIDDVPPPPVRDVSEKYVSKDQV